MQRKYNLAKVEVASSNLVSRSKRLNGHSSSGRLSFEELACRAWTERNLTGSVTYLQGSSTTVDRAYPHAK